MNDAPPTPPTRKRPKEEQALLDMFQQDVERRDALLATGVIERPSNAVDPATGRLNYDLSKASKRCPHCSGTGLRPPRVRMLAGEITIIKVVCRCVSRNGGVRKTLFQKKIDAVNRHLDRQAAKRAKNEKKNKAARRRRRKSRNKR